MSIRNSIDIYRAAGELYYHLRQYLGDGELTMGSGIDGGIMYRWRTLSPAGCVVWVHEIVSPRRIVDAIPDGVASGGDLVKSIGDQMRQTRENRYRASW